MTHVPYRGGAPAIQSVIAGDTQVTFGTSPSVLPQAKRRRLRALAVSTRERSPLVPDLPGMREAGLPDYNLEFWYGLFVPAGTPPAIVRKIYDATVAAMQQAAGQSGAGARGDRGVAVGIARAVREVPGRGRRSSGSTSSRARRSRSSEARAGGIGYAVGADRDFD